MEVRTIGVWHNNKCPFSGNGLVVVVEKTESRAHLFYPFTLEEWTMPVETKYDDSGNLTVEGYELAAKDGAEYTNSEKIAAIIRDNVRKAVLFNRSFPAKTVARVLSDLNGTSLATEESLLAGHMSVSATEKPNVNAEKLSRKIKLKKHEELAGRDAVVAAAMRKLGPATVGQILDEAFKSWPTRAGKTADRSKAERHVVFCTNRWVTLGWAEAQ